MKQNKIKLSEKEVKLT